MTGAVLDRPDTQQFDLDGGLTLEELLNATLEAARATGSTKCPVCHARMTCTRASAECGGCGSRLS
jgi:hypothetical protein